MAEEWRDVPGYEGKYQVSNKGRVRSLDRWVKNGKKSKRFHRGGILKHSLSTVGYPYISLTEGRKTSIHRLVLEVFVGPCPKGMETRHLNGIRTDNRLENLCWGTNMENHQDKIRHGNSIRGEKSWSSKLTETDILEIRNMLKQGIVHRVIAEQYGVGRRTIGDIANNACWAWLE